MAFRRWSSVVVVLSIVVAVVGLIVIEGRGNGAESDFCGSELRLRPGVKVTDFEDRYGIAVAESMELLPVEDTPIPTQIGDLVRIGNAWAVEPEDDKFGPGWTSLGHVSARTGDCRLWLLLSTGEALPPGRSEAWIVTVVEVARVR